MTGLGLQAMGATGIGTPRCVKRTPMCRMRITFVGTDKVITNEEASSFPMLKLTSGS